MRYSPGFIATAGALSLPARPAARSAGVANSKPVGAELPGVVLRIVQPARAHSGDSRPPSGTVTVTVAAMLVCCKTYVVVDIGVAPSLVGEAPQRPTRWSRDSKK